MSALDSNALIIFIKNPILGKVKTRLASTIGDKKALKIYHYLLSRTREVVEEVEETERFVFYSDYIPAKDEWKDEEYEKKLQIQGKLGEKMMEAFRSVFDEGFEQVVMISPDCPKLRPSIIENAFRKLNDHDCVIGPTEDGGYYLIGMKEIHEKLFINKKFSTETIYKETIEEMESNGLSYFVLPQLLDVDREEDLGNLKSLLKEKTTNNEEDLEL